MLLLQVGVTDDDISDITENILESLEKKIQEHQYQQVLVV